MYSYKINVLVNLYNTMASNIELINYAENMKNSISVSNFTNKDKIVKELSNFQLTTSPNIRKAILFKLVKLMSK